MSERHPAERRHDPAGDPVLGMSPATPGHPEGAAQVADAAVLPPSGPPPRASRTLWGDAVRRLRRNRLALAGLVWISLMLVLALSADLWVPKTLGDPERFDTTQVAGRRLLDSSFQHPFGTDHFGRDVLARAIYGARISLAVGVLAVAISVALGLILGSLSGYYGRWLDSFVMRLSDVFLAFPYILFVIALIAVLGKGLQNVFIAIGILGWPSIARVVRSSILSIKENDYVDAARALGASDGRIMLRHILPNAMAPVIVYATMSTGGAILTEAALSFLGMGVVPPTPSWGNMLAESRSYLFTAPWLMIYPGIAILTTVLAFVLLGDGLRDALDVKMKD